MLQSNYLNTYSMNWILQSKLRPRVQLQQQQQYYHGRDYQRCPRGANRVVPLCCLDDALWDTQCSKMRKAVQYKYVQYVFTTPNANTQCFSSLSLSLCQFVLNIPNSAVSYLRAKLHFFALCYHFLGLRQTLINSNSFRGLMQETLEAIFLLI